MSAINVLAEAPTTQAIPENLLYEELNGRKLYRKGYKNVIHHTKTIEEIIESSSLQGMIISILLRYLYTHTKVADFEIMTKSQILFSFGVERVIWFFTHNKKVLLATSGQDWIMRDWNKNIELLDGHVINLQTLIDQKGIVL